MMVDGALVFTWRPFLQALLTNVRWCGNLCAIGQLCDPTFIWPQSPYFKGSENGCAIFVTWKLTKWCMKLELCSILFQEQALAHWVLNKNSTSKYTVASLCTVGHTHRSKTFKVWISTHNLVNFEATKMAHPFWNPWSKGTESKDVRSHNCLIAHKLPHHLTFVG